jgi:hypothetical protein
MLLLPLLQGGEELLVMVNAENVAPSITVPPQLLQLSALEDTPLVIAGLAVTDIDATAANTGCELSVALSAQHGTLSLATTSGLAFSLGDGSSDTAMRFAGTAGAANEALRSVVYKVSAACTLSLLLQSMCM